MCMCVTLAGRVGGEYKADMSRFLTCAMRFLSIFPLRGFLFFVFLEPPPPLAFSRFPFISSVSPTDQSAGAFPIDKHRISNHTGQWGSGTRPAGGAGG